jgi:cytochrome c-type biogenesis protein CcmH/NrfG
MNIPSDQWSGANATKEMQAILIRQHEETKRQGRKVIFLTALILAVTLLTLYFLIRPYQTNSELDQPLRSPAVDFPHSQ